MPDSQRLLADLTSWYWWLMVVVAGILINIASAYLKTPLDRILNRWSSRRKTAFDLEAKRQTALAKVLAAHPGLLALEVRKESVTLLLAIFALALGATSLALASWAHTAASAISTKVVTVGLVIAAIALFVIAMRAFSQSRSYSERLHLVQKQFLGGGEG